MSRKRADRQAIAFLSLLLFCVAMGGVAAGDAPSKGDPPDAAATPDMRAERDWAAALRADSVDDAAGWWWALPARCTLFDGDMSVTAALLGWVQWLDAGGAAGEAGA